MSFLPWILWIVAGVALAFSIQRALGARRRGEPTPLIALVLTGVVFAAVTAVAPLVSPMSSLFAAGSAAVPSVQVDPQTATSRLQTMQRQSTQLSDQLKKLQSDETSIQQQLEQPTVSSIALPERADTGPGRVILAVLLVALVAVDLAVLLFAAQLQLLVPEGLVLGRDGRREAQMAALDKLTELVWNQNYREALAKASEIVELKLPRPDMSDLFYLRSYAAVQVYAFPEPGETPEYRKDLLAAAIHDLQSVVDAAPKRGEPIYLLGLAYGLAGQDAEALEMFERARKLLGAVKLPFDQNESVCLLREGEQRLSIGDTEAAEACFDRVARLGKLSASVLNVRIRISMNELRKSVGMRAIAAAEATLQKIIGFAGLTAEQNASVNVIRIELTARNALIQKDPVRAAAETDTFVASYLPQGLPPVDDQVVDEPFSPLLDADLPLPRQVYRGILFMQAIARCQIETRGRTSLTDTQASRIAEPLLLALQFQPRHRDLLAAIGGLYYWTRRDLRAKAREWLDAAIAMGVDSKYARLIVTQDIAVEGERRGALDLFKASSARFLRDPSLAAEVRRALVEELSRFQEFEPMLISLQELPELEPQEPTVAALRERGRHLSRLLERVAGRGEAERHARLSGLQAEHAKVLAALEQSAQNLETLERRVIGELGDVLAMT